LKHIYYEGENTFDNLFESSDELNRNKRTITEIKHYWKNIKRDLSSKLKTEFAFSKDKKPFMKKSKIISKKLFEILTKMENSLSEKKKTPKQNSKSEDQQSLTGSRSKKQMPQV
jgi:hypothetical protein